MNRFACLSIVVMLVVGTKCGYRTADGTTPSRFYKCEDQRGLQRPALYVDTHRADTIIYVGDGIEFTDVKTNAHIRLREADGYWCRPVAAVAEQEKKR